LRFTDFLKTTVLASAAAATTLAAACVIGASAHSDARLVLIAAGWWLAAAALGAYVGRRPASTPAIGRLLASARASTTLPEQRAGAVLLNRLWPLLLVTVAAAGVAFVAPQVPAIATGFTIIWALTWRRQESAVTAIEERDGVRFYVEPTSPVSPMKLVRTPGFKAFLPGLDRAA
jgi:hypothetical protein